MFIPGKPPRSWLQYAWPRQARPPVTALRVAVGSGPGQPGGPGDLVIVVGGAYAAELATRETTVAGKDPEIAGQHRTQHLLHISPGQSR